MNIPWKTNLQQLNIRDYFAALRRRRVLALTLAGATLIICTALAWLLPAVYRSEATILIERQEIPTDFVRSTVTSFADQRIQVISQRVMTSTNLIEIVNRYDMYAEERKSVPIQTVVEEMREDITLEMISADVVDPRSGKPREATIAFKLAFDSDSPELARRVANELVSLYLNENIKDRTEAAAETSTFLSAEADELRQNVEALEAKLAEFKSENLQNRPELEGITRDIINRTELRLAEINQRINVAEQQRIYAVSELAKIEPTTTDTSPGAVDAARRLSLVETELAAAESAYGERHPDVRKLRKQAEAARSQVDPSVVRDLYERELASAQSALAELLEKYGEQHPEMGRAKSKVETLKLKLGSLPSANDDPPDNPIYLTFAARRDSANSEIQALKVTRADLQKKIDEYTENLLKIPDVEAEYRAISRDYENALAKYQEVTGKQMEARLSESLETDNKGERFVLIEPPVRPERPDSPNRLAIFLVGAMLALTSGLGSVGVAEALDTRIRGRRGIQQVLGVPPLVSVPYIDEVNRPFHRRHPLTITVASILVLLLVALLLFHVFVKPLDVTWYILLRRIGI